MENASKALLIAGGVLIAVVITSVIVYMYNTIREFPKAQEQTKAEREIEKFNKQYQSYEKEGIRGTDVITLVNKAISHNKAADEAGELAEQEINVYITTNEEIVGYLIEYEYNDVTRKVEETNRSQLGAITLNRLDEEDLTNETLYESSPWKDILDPDTGTLSGDYQYANASGGEVTPKDDPNWNWNHYYMRSFIGAEFKRKKFDCVITDYHDNGRVAEIKITEQY